MARVSQTIKNMISGISQQPDLLRLPEQLDQQVNGFSTEASGLQKRPPTLYVADLGSVPVNDKPLIHFIKRDEVEKYIMLFDGVSLKVWDDKGLPHSVSYEGSGNRYLLTDTPRESLRIITIADYTFVVNKEKKVQKSSKLVPFYWSDYSCLIHIKSGQYGRTYKIIINNEEIASFSTPDGSDPSHTKQIDTNYIRDRLAENVIQKGWQVEKHNSCLYLTNTNTRIESVKCTDGFNGQGMFGIFHTVQKFTNLPIEAQDGYTVQVLGDTGASADDYYVQYSAKENVWKECAKPGIIASFDASTMPHVITRNADGTFTVKPAPWEDRSSGDDDSNPFPSFVNESINDVFLFRNRLGFLSKENVILSQSAHFFNFWFSSAVEVQETDPIDLAVSNNEVDILNYAIPFAQDLLIFSANAQFIISAEGALTPKNAAILLATNFPSTKEVCPVKAGSRLYFVTKRSEYSSLNEYFTMNDTQGTKNAQDISSHVPTFIPNGVFKICASHNEHLLLLLSTGAPSRIYVYKYLFAEDNRIQSSWSYWEFKKAKIYGGGFFDSSFFLLIDRGGELFLEKMLFTYNTKDYEEELYRVYMDRKGLSTPIEAENYDSINDRTQLHLKDFYKGFLTEGATYGIVTPTGLYYTFDYKAVRDDSIWIPGDLRKQKVIFGELYTFYAQLSKILVRNNKDQGAVVEGGRLQLRRIILNFAKSGYFDIYVAFKDTRKIYTYTHTARILGKAGTTINSIPLDTGDFAFPIMGKNEYCTISIQTNTPTPISLIGYTWEGNYIKRTKTI